MELHLGAQLRDANGDRFGVIHRLVLDAQTGRVEGLSVQHEGMDNHEVLVPFAALSAGDDKAAVANLTPAQFEALGRFVRTRNTAPPPDAAEVDETQIDDPIDVPDVPAIGAATGIESIAFTPILEETMNVAPGQVVLDGSTTIEATDGEVGRVRGAVVDDGAGTLLALMAHRGLIFTHDALVARVSIESLDGETVRLRVDRAAVQPA